MDRKKVLIVDDDPCILEMTKSGLEMLWYVVETAENATEAKHAAAAKSPDIILMDVGLPGTNGISLCRDIRIASGERAVPIIIVTAYSDAATVNDALMFGASDYVTKPFEMHEVQKKIEHCLKEKGNSR
jgi:two-component system KDP operon response regulator KdpE